LKDEDQVPTASPATPNRTYGAHRERQQRRILAAAQELFDERGIDRVAVSEIVTAAGIRPSTLYEYFSNKDEIVWALVENLLRESFQRIDAAMTKATGSAFEKISALLHAFEEELVQEPARVRFMAQFDAMYAREWSADQLIELENRLFPDTSKGLSDLIREGIADGSLRPDLIPELTMHAVLNAAIGTVRRLASLGPRVEQEYGQPINLLFHESVRILLLGIRAT
jgi:AcrR family transcriptional regulator